MQGVAIHANILNTILKHRVVQVMPGWANALWGTALIFVMLIGRERWKIIPHPTQKVVLGYIGFILMLALAVMLPVLAFRYTPYKFSIYTPFAGLLLATPTIEAFDKAFGLLRDLRRRRRLRRGLPPLMRASMLDILKAERPEQRLQRAFHFLQMQFHTACAILFDEASERDIIGFDLQSIASPTLHRITAEVERMKEIAQAPRPAQQAAQLVMALHADPTIREALRLSRSLYIASNEIRRQRAAHDEEEGRSDEKESVSANVSETSIGYTDLMVMTLSEQGHSEYEEEFDKLYKAIESYAAKATEIMRVDGKIEDLLPAERELFPYAIRRVCQTHKVEETFIYFNEQEDANNRDDFFDIVYGGRLIDCQPVEHPGLAKFREYVAKALEAESQG